MTVQIFSLTITASILLIISQAIRWQTWAPYLRLAGRGMRVVNTRYGGKWAWLAGRNGSVRLDCGRSRYSK